MYQFVKNGLWMFFIAISLFLPFGCGSVDGMEGDESGEWDEGESVVQKGMALSVFSQVDREDGLPVGFDRSAVMVTWDQAGRPRSSLVATALPVLHFSGYNMTGDMIAYTSLERLLSRPAPKRVKVSWRESQNLTLDDLVPTGQLLVQDRSGVKRISQEGEFVVFASWSPTDPQVLAYGYTHADTTGIVVVNVETLTRVASIQGTIDPDAFFWQDDAQSLSVYQIVEPLEDAEEVANNHGKTVSYRVGTWRLADESLSEEGAPSVKNGTMYPSNGGLEIATRAGTIFTANLAGGDDNEYASTDRDGRLKSTYFRAEQIRARNSTGIVFVNSTDGALELYALGGTATTQMRPTLILASSGVSYYIPNPAGSTVNFTQVGQSYPGGGCLVWNHTSGSSMAYAIDIQLSGSSYDDVLASAVGTVSSFVSSVTCNASDTNNCGSYTNPCSSNSGWGNDVILAHSDGFYTKYTHLQQANFQVHTVGASASAGCWLAREGATGNTSGNKNGCGDHLHFQKQSGSSLSANSASVSFVEDSSITSADCTSKSPSKGGMSCSL